MLILAQNYVKFLINRFKRRRDAVIKCVASEFFFNHPKKNCMKLKAKKKFYYKNNKKKRERCKKKFAVKKNSLDWKSSIDIKNNQVNKEYIKIMGTLEQAYSHIYVMSHKIDIIIIISLCPFSIIPMNLRMYTTKVRCPLVEDQAHNQCIISWELIIHRSQILNLI